MIKWAHYRRLKAFKDTKLTSYICDEDTKPFELPTNCAKNHQLPFLEFGSLLWGPTPSMPYLYSDTLLHRSDIQNIVVSAHVLAGVFTKTCWNWPARESSRINQVSIPIFNGLQIDARMLWNRGQIAFHLKFWPAIRTSPHNFHTWLVWNHVQSLVAERPSSAAAMGQACDPCRLMIFLAQHAYPESAKSLSTGTRC